MRKPGAANRGDDIHPPDQRGKRASPQDLARALQRQPGDPEYFGLVYREAGYAKQKIVFYQEHPEIPGACDRLNSAGLTVALTDSWNLEALRKKGELIAKNRENAKLPRTPMTSEVEAVVAKLPNATAKRVAQELELRVGVEGSPITALSVRGFEWSWRGRTGATSSHGIAKILTRLRNKPPT
jgi:hypothetical protein